MAHLQSNLWLWGMRSARSLSYYSTLTQGARLSLLPHWGWAPLFSLSPQNHFPFRPACVDVLSSQFLGRCRSQQWSMFILYPTWRLGPESSFILSFLFFGWTCCGVLLYGLTHTSGTLCFPVTQWFNAVFTLLRPACWLYIRIQDVFFNVSPLT